MVKPPRDDGGIGGNRMVDENKQDH
jgi:hypothetical protein